MTDTFIQFCNLFLIFHCKLSLNSVITYKMSLISYMSAVDRVDTLKRIRIFRFTRVITDRSNPMEDLTELEFCKRYRFKKDTIKYILDIIVQDLEITGPKRGVELPKVLQLLVAISFYATGSFQAIIGDVSSLSQGTVCTIVSKISHCIAKHTHQFIKFPTHAEAAKNRSAFYEIAGFPGVVGAIDCTHVRINSPGGPNAELFRNRKGYFSINVQACCNAQLKFTNIVARWYGSCHDSRIFDNSSLKLDMQEKKLPGILLGDGGYALLPYLMTPFESPATGPQRKYNISQIKTRNTIERMFGVWKRRFSCLTILRLKMKNALAVIIATAVLHNIARDHADYSVEEHEEDTEGNMSSLNRDANDTIGCAVRNCIVNSHFS